MAKLLRELLSKLRKKKNFLETETSVRYKWLGSDYGGFFVATDILDTKKGEGFIVYSAGVGTDISFDKAIMRRYKSAKIYAFDPTPISKAWIKRKKLPANFTFEPICIGTKNGKKRCFCLALTA